MMKNEWWKKSVVYQIYPKSFYDSNGDGIGDIKGITNKLYYLKNLGIDIIWICPIYKSPMKDGGYDIADYKAIDPMFGNLEDMDELIKKADDMGIKILMDLVVNHTSSEHEWFKEALKNPNSKYRDYYIFKKGIDGNPPNNWRSYFGGSAWERVPNEDNMYYLHAFAKEQPDLNWENNEVRQEVINMVNWWLDKGLGGFRIDAILNLKKSNIYGNFEPDGEDGLSHIGKWIVNQPGIETWLKELDDKTFRKHNSFTVAEADVPDGRLQEYIGDNGFFRTVFDFSYADIDIPKTGEWYKNSNWKMSDLKNAIFKNELFTQRVGWGARYLENHDQPRSINKYIPEKDINDTSKKLLATLFMMLRGTPFIYQGQEIGMENIKMTSINDYNDVSTFDQYDRAILNGLTKEQAFECVSRRSRDNSRTPIQWSTDKNAGFSTADKTWLKVNPNYTDINVEAEEKDINSVLSYYKKLIELRKCDKYGEIVINGYFFPVENTKDEIIAYKRILEDKEILVILNFSDENNVFNLNHKYNLLLSNFLNSEKTYSDDITLCPYGACILIKE